MPGAEADGAVQRTVVKGLDGFPVLSAVRRAQRGASLTDDQLAIGRGGDVVQVPVGEAGRGCRPASLRCCRLSAVDLTEGAESKPVVWMAGGLLTSGVRR